MTEIKLDSLNTLRGEIAKLRIALGCLPDPDSDSYDNWGVSLLLKFRSPGSLDYQTERVLAHVFLKDETLKGFLREYRRALQTEIARLETVFANS